MMKTSWLVFCMASAFSVSAHAEYYMVYPASSVCYTSCGDIVYPHHQTHAAAKHPRNYYHIDVKYIWYAYPGEVQVSSAKNCSCGGCYGGCSTNNYNRLKSSYSSSPVRYDHEDDATYYAPDLDGSTADDVNY